MKKILIYIIILLAFGCSSTQKKEVKLHESQSLASTYSNEIQFSGTKASNSLFIDSSNFKFFELKEFNLRAWYYGKINKELKSLTQENIKIYLQDSKIKINNTNTTRFKYFSIQKNTPTEKIITILDSDGCCNELHYLVYNGQNKLLSDNIVAGTGGDGTWSYNKYGKFLNDSTYILTQVDIDVTEFEKNKSETRIDSVVTTFQFYKNSTFKKISEQKFKEERKS